MRLFRFAFTLICVVAMMPRALAVPTGDGGEYFPGTLEVGGQLKFTNGFNTGVTDNYVLTLGADGFATWQEASDAAASLPGTTIDNLTLTNAEISGATIFSNTTLDNSSSITFTGTVLQGTVNTNPGLTFTGPFDAALSKLYRDGETDPSADPAVNVDAAGRVGIGTGSDALTMGLSVVTLGADNAVFQQSGSTKFEIRPQNGSTRLISKTAAGGAETLILQAGGAQTQQLVLGTGGNVGVGVAPGALEALLHVGGSAIITGALKFTNGIDGNQDGYVLTTDADGNATWQPPTVASTDFTDTSLIGTTSFQAESGTGETTAIVTGDITFDNVDADNRNSILYKAVLENPAITGDLTSMESLNVTTQLSVTGSTDLADVGADSITVTGAISAASFSGDGSAIDNVVAVGLDLSATVPATQISAGALPAGVTIPADQITDGTFIGSLSFPAAQIDGAIGGDVTSIDISTGGGTTGTITADKFFGDGSALEGVEADSLAADAEIDIAKTTTDVLALDPSATMMVASAQPSIQVANSLVRIQGDNTSGIPGTNTTLTTIEDTATLKDGQILIFRGMSNDYKVSIQSGGNLVLNSGVTFLLGDRDTISFVYDAQATPPVWIETSRSDAI